MPASVLLALLVATSLLALTPALVRRYDPDERMIADRAASDGRVLTREPHRPEPDRDAPDEPGETPAPGPVGVPEASPGRERRGSGRGESVRLEVDQSVTGEDPEMSETARLRQMRAEWWRRRHRRILYVLIALTLLELLGVVVAGPGFWLGAGIALVVLGAYVYFLRARAKQRRGGRAARRPRAMLTTEPDDEPEEGPPTYVPEQPGADDGYEDEEHRESFLFENGTLHEPEDPPQRPEARRPDSTGGIRGRSYESPAKLEGLCLSRPSTATS
ncbi:hypothetical protein [Glycomyces arizonensis]|uniref:hypothetical protein n=1 Tax=Glycomyces arizonensis TaxID=256035 RepID=UPI0004006907|nr:hypothetical protein [Glycomyces arizonensis]